LLNDRKIQCWGLNAWGQLGNGTSTTSAIPVPVSDINSAIATSASSAYVGSSRNCAVLVDNSVQCWSSFGTLDSTGSNYSAIYIPLQVVGFTGALKVAAGDVPCIVTTAGAVQCATYKPSNGGSFAIATVDGISNAVDVAVGAGHTCALLNDGTVWCWGGNANGQLGDGTKKDSSNPVQASGITTAVAIGVGNAFSCAVLSDGTAKCWGVNDVNQLGVARLYLSAGYGTASAYPVTVDGISNAVGIAVGYCQSCVLRGDGTYSCWGAGP
jgi:alpha-tubulin suppressor-like RCC1 family protein